ncbi:unnamed protein product, partial [Urochloa humidicola]
SAIFPHLPRNPKNFKQRTSPSSLPHRRALVPFTPRNLLPRAGSTHRSIPVALSSPSLAASSSPSPPSQVSPRPLSPPPTKQFRSNHFHGPRPSLSLPCYINKIAPRRDGDSDDSPGFIPGKLPHLTPDDPRIQAPPPRGSSRNGERAAAGQRRGRLRPPPLAVPAFPDSADAAAAAGWGRGEVRPARRGGEPAAAEAHGGGG